MPKNVTRQDVALAAGVSGATVSRVYNAPSLVDKATGDRVRAAAAALGFVPDKNAAALRRRSNATILFVEIEQPGYHWPSQRAFQSLYGEIVRAVLHANQESSFSLQLVALPSIQAIPTLERFGSFAGILGFDVSEQPVADALAALGRPVVCAHHGDQLTGVSTVTTDNREGGRIQARYLIDQGWRSVAYVTGMQDQLRSHQQRKEGFLSVLEPTQVLDGFVGYAEGQRAGRLLAPEVRKGAIQAFACVNDLTALGVVQGLAAEGLSVPGDAAVIGYDNLVLTGLLGQGLPSIEARLPEVYNRALAVLTSLISGTGREVHEAVAPVLVTG